MGPPHAHVTQIVDALAAAYGFQVLDAKALVESCSDELKSRLFPTLDGEFGPTAEIVAVLLANALGLDGNVEAVRAFEKKSGDLKQLLEKVAAAADDDEKAKLMEGVEVDEAGTAKEVDPPLLEAPKRSFIVLNMHSKEHYAALAVYGIDIHHTVSVSATEEPEKVETEADPEGEGAAEGEAAAETGPPPIDFEALAAEFENAITVPDQPLENAIASCRKAVDPFFPRVADPSSVPQIPDPNEEIPAVEEGEEPPEPKFIPWGPAGGYCPVTLSLERWLVPGSMEYSVTVGHEVFACATQGQLDSFTMDPFKYLSPPTRLVPPPPRIMVTGTTSAGVTTHCEILRDAYKLPILKLSTLFKTEYTTLKEARSAKLLEEKKALFDAQEPELDEEGEPIPREFDPGEEEPMEGEEALEMRVKAMRSVLGAHIGACILDGQFFADVFEGDADQGEGDDNATLDVLIRQALRVPDICIVVSAPDDVCAKRHLDLDLIDKEDEERKAREKAERGQRRKEAETEEEAEAIVEPEDDGEKASEKALRSFKERLTAQRALLLKLTESFASSVPVREISTIRPIASVTAGIQLHCMPFVSQRSTLFTRQQCASISRKQAERALRSHVATTAHDRAPTDFPVFLKDRVYFFDDEEARQSFLRDPMEEDTSRKARHPQVVPAICVVGAPHGAPHELAAALCTRLGCVRISVTDVLEDIIAQSPLSALGAQISDSLRAGQVVPDELLSQAIRRRLLRADVLRHGWLLDEFPHTEEQMGALCTVGVIPRVACFLSTGWETRPATSSEDTLRRPLFAVERSFAQRTLPQLRASLEGQCVVVRLDAAWTQWRCADRVLAAVQKNLRETQQYYACEENRTPYPHMLDRICRRSKKRATYCPVSWALEKSLVSSASGDVGAWLMVRGEAVFVRDSYVDAFTANPDAFLDIPLPEDRPRRVHAKTEKKADSGAKPATAAVGGNCPVHLEAENVLVPGVFWIEYHLRTYVLCCRRCVQMFMRRPWLYKNVKMDLKIPSQAPKFDATRFGANTEQKLDIAADSLTYLQMSASTALQHALTACSEIRPLYPNKTVRESALLYVAQHLRARGDPLKAQWMTVKEEEKLTGFLRGCDMPEVYLREVERSSQTAELTSQDVRTLKELEGDISRMFVK